MFTRWHILRRTEPLCCKLGDAILKPITSNGVRKQLASARCLCISSTCCRQYTADSSRTSPHPRAGSSSGSYGDSKGSWYFLGGSAVLAATAYTIWKKNHRCQTWMKVYAAENETNTAKVTDEPTVSSSTENAKGESKPDCDSVAEPAATAGEGEEASEESKKAPKPAYPEHVNYLIIGGGTAAYHACTAIRVKDTRGKVLIVSEESMGPYSRPPLSKNLWFTKDREKARHLFYQDGTDYLPIFYQRPTIYVEPSDLSDCENGAVALALNRKVVKLDVWRRKAFLDDGTEIKYDKCLIATGGRPKSLPVFDQAGPEVAQRTLLFRGATDYWKLDTISANAKSVAVIGGGFLGSELACALAYAGKENNLKVYQTFPESGNLGKVLPSSLSKWATEEMREMGIDVKTDDTVVSAAYEDDQVVLTLESGQKICADYVVVSVGIQPNTELAESSGLEVDAQHGGFRVNAEMQARSDVYVAGDASCFYDTILGRRRVEHYEHAEITGHIAGENMTGGNMPYWIQSSFWSDLYPFLNLEAVGLVDSSLETVIVMAGEPKNTPQAAERSGPSESQKDTAAAQQTLTEDYLGGGVVFYLNNDRIVGVLTWNLPGKSRVPLARRLLRDGGKGKDFLEIAQLFDPLAQNTFKKKELPPPSKSDDDTKSSDSTGKSEESKTASNKHDKDKTSENSNYKS